MVATTGMQDGQRWTLAKSLVALFIESDQRAPNRSKVSDGTIGDPDHQSRTSDHNPDASGDVLGADLTDDKAGGCDADLLAQHIVAGRDGRVKYVIWNATIVRSYDRPATSTRPFLAAWTPEPYTGVNAHEHHTHISVKDTAAGKDDTSPWWPPTQGDDMPLTSADLDDIEKRVVAALDKRGASGSDQRDAQLLAEIKALQSGGASADQIVDEIATRLQG